MGEHGGENRFLPGRIDSPLGLLTGKTNSSVGKPIPPLNN